MLDHEGGSSPVRKFDLRCRPRRNTIDDHDDGSVLLRLLPSIST
jgi:hypothetical protein